jgi:hypothetical protein
MHFRAAASCGRSIPAYLRGSKSAGRNANGTLGFEETGGGGQTRSIKATSARGVSADASGIAQWNRFDSDTTTGQNGNPVRLSTIAGAISSKGGTAASKRATVLISEPSQLSLAFRDVQYES